MPTYEYACQSCQKVFDVFQSMRDAPLTACPNCGKPGVKRLIGRGAGIIFKGSGFYETDYKRQPEKKPASESSDKAAASTSATASAPAPSTSAPAAAAASTTSTTKPSAPAAPKSN